MFLFNYVMISMNIYLIIVPLEAAFHTEQEYINNSFWQKNWLRPLLHSRGFSSRPFLQAADFSSRSFLQAADAVYRGQWIKNSSSWKRQII